MYNLHYYTLLWPEIQTLSRVLGCSGLVERRWKSMWKNESCPHLFHETDHVRFSFFKITSTFPRSSPFVTISFLILSTPYMTVEWSRLPRSFAIASRVTSVYSLQMYMMTWRGTTRDAFFLRERMLLTRTS